MTKKISTLTLTLFFCIASIGMVVGLNPNDVRAEECEDACAYLSASQASLTDAEGALNSTPLDWESRRELKKALRQAKFKIPLAKLELVKCRSLGTEIVNLGEGDLVELLDALGVVIGSDNSLTKDLLLTLAKSLISEAQIAIIGLDTAGALVDIGNANLLIGFVMDDIGCEI